MNFKILGIVIVIVIILKFVGFFDFPQKIEMQKDNFSVIHKQKLDDMDVIVIKDNNNEQFVVIRNEKGIAITKRF